MKKGFTIIELIAVITIIAILIAVAFVTISGTINSAKVKAYNQNIDKVIETTELYVANGNLDSPLDVGDTAEIAVEELITAGYLKAIKSPFDKSKTCNGYVLVEKTIDDDYLYFPYLNCIADIGNSTEDKLILHYTFDDFQEPTTNLVVRPEFNTTSMGYPWGSWDTTVLTFGTANVLGYDTTYTNITKQTSGSVNAIHQAIGSLTIGSSYTLSYYVRISPNSASTTGTIRAYINDGYVNYAITKEWKKITLTRTATAVSHTIHITQYSNLYDVQIAHVQFEKKAYSTAFVNGARTGIVKDYSINNKNGSLLLLNTPTWTETGYYFDGIDDFIDAGTSGSLGIGNEMTYLSWIKMDNVSDDVRVGNIIGKYPVAPLFNFEGYFLGKLRIYWNNGQLDLLSSKDIRGSWHLVGFVRNKISNTIKIYIDGELQVTAAVTGDNIDIQWPLRIGGDYRATPGVPFHGYIDDVRIYSRALSIDEIKMMYTLNKDNYD